MMRRRGWLMAAVIIVAAVVGFSPLYGKPTGQSGQAAMFGNTPSRNMVSDETNLPDTWDIESGLNVKWSQPVGSQAYAGPVVLDGQVYVGTNNEGLSDTKLTGSRREDMAFKT